MEEIELRRLMCAGTDRTAQPNILRNKWNCATWYQREQKEQLRYCLFFAFQSLKRKSRVRLSDGQFVRIPHWAV